MNIQSCVCVTPWVWRGFYWIQGTLYEIADQTYCQDTVLELCWQHWKWEITQISIWEEDNQQCTLSVRLYLLSPLLYPLVVRCSMCGAAPRVSGRPRMTRTGRAASFCPSTTAPWPRTSTTPSDRDSSSRPRPSPRYRHPTNCIVV